MQLIDANAYHEIFARNIYNVQQSEVRDRVVFDIGANLGVFSRLCLNLGARKVIAIEAQPYIYKELYKNLYDDEVLNVAVAINAAIGSRDGDTVRISNEGGNSKVGTVGDKVQTLSLHTLVTKALPLVYRNEVSSNPAVLKMDCEGSEFDVLMTVDSDLMRYFDTIYIEIHANTNPNPAWHDPKLVQNKLESWGFHLASSVPMLAGPAPDQLIYPTGTVIEKWLR
jgi:FkbM family methyltransferase